MTVFADWAGTTLTISRCSFSEYAVILLSSLKGGYGKQNMNFCLLKTIVSQKTTFRMIGLVEHTCWLNLAKGLQRQTFWVNSISCWLPVKFEGLNISHLQQILTKCVEVKITISRMWKMAVQRKLYIIVMKCWWGSKWFVAVTFQVKLHT